VLPPQVLRPLEVVRRIHVEEEHPGIAERGDAVQRERAHADVCVEADGPEVLLVEVPPDGRLARRCVDGAQWLDAARSSPEVRNGMSQAVTSTGPGPAVRAE
jgi:hypothetical protein